MSEVNVVSLDGPMIHVVNATVGLQGPRGPTGPAGGTVTNYVGAIALGGHMAVTLDSVGAMTVADCTQAAHAHGVVGITLGASAQGFEAPVIKTGSLEHLGWSFLADKPVYLGLAGQIVQVLPATALFVKVLGLAVTATRITVDFQPAIFLDPPPQQIL
jgi:hypothetical protein